MHIELRFISCDYLSQLVWIVLHCQSNEALANIHMCILYVKSKSLNELIHYEAMFLLEETVVATFID